MARRSHQRRTQPKSQRPRAIVPRPPSTRSPADKRTRALWWAVALTALVLLLTVDDRYPGAIADGRQMAWTAIAITETGEIGQARGRDFTWPRTEGDAVSRYGMGMSLAQIPAAWMAPRIEARLGPGASQPLFLIVPLLCVCAAAAAAGWIALGLGLSAGGVAAAVLLTALGSPLGSYASLDLSEPLQSAALTLAVACALAISQPNVTKRAALRCAFLAGLAAGVAILTKSSLWVAAPFALLPLLRADAPVGLRARILCALGGLAVPVGGWIHFEISRFGRLFASYGGEGFTHPLLDGLWRLLVGPNRGLLLYFPALAIAVAALAFCYRGPSSRSRSAVTASIGIFTVLLVVAACWWAWHGLWGWGPRFLVPALPPLAASAAVALDRWRSPVRYTVLIVSMLVNLPGLLQNAAPVTLFVATCPWPTADAALAESLAGYARRTDPNGTYRIAPEQVLEATPQASPFLVYPWFARASRGETTEQRAQMLGAPPWIQSRPDISCRNSTTNDLEARLRARPGWPMWGRAFWPDRDAPGFPGVYDEGLLDQVVRAQQVGRGDLALTLSRKLGQLRPGGEADARILESLRMLKRRTEAVDYLSGLSRERRSEPEINIVRALFERDAGSEELARGLLGSVVQYFPGTPAARAVAAPLTEWPRDLNAMTASGTDQAGR